ncbi:hypothetical protein [Halopiger goleimassiliensis]|uniref:hypothetical protein n=1 Tax=Halopiger goleimassiliensis TaxID=1293048 RepID=UPI00067795AE|nr:hypothetical protein [Halopiger goleimassiliensis]
MASDDADGGSISVSLPAEVDDWLAATAERRDEDRATTCRRLLSAVHEVTTGADDPVDPERIVDLERELEEQREEYTELIEDVRSRVIQVKRETDGRAPADHDHEAYASDADLEALAADLESIVADLERLEDRLEGGFDNFEEVLDHLLDRTDALENRAAVLARTILDVRDRQETLLERERRRRRVEELQLAANQLGVRTAACEECGASVDVALLTAPECPACASPVADVAENTSWFGSHTLVTGDPPALEGEVADAEPAEELYDVIEADATDDAGPTPSLEREQR